MRPLIQKFTPSRGFAHAFYFVYNALLPLLVFLLVRISFTQLALALILLSKWRMIAVRPRFWSANIRANAIDIIVGISVLSFMVATTSEALQLLWVVLWGAWLVWIKPKADTPGVSAQAFIGFAIGLTAMFYTWDHAPLYVLVGAVGLICYFGAYHFFNSFDEPYVRLLAYLWGYFGAALTWVLGHWLLFYGAISQPTLILTAMALGMGSLYYLDHLDRLSQSIRRQVVFIMIAVLLVVLVFSDWGDKIV